MLASGIEIELSVSDIAELLGVRAAQCDLPSRWCRMSPGLAMRLVTGAGTAAGSDHPDQTMIKLLRKARRWWRRICAEGIRASHLAREEDVSSAITRVIRLAMLLPKLVDEITAAPMVQCSMRRD